MRVRARAEIVPQKCQRCFKLLPGAVGGALLGGPIQHVGAANQLPQRNAAGVPHADADTAGKRPRWSDHTNRQSPADHRRRRSGEARAPDRQRAVDRYIAASRSISPRWGSIRYRLALRTYAPWGVRVVPDRLTKSRKIPTRNILPLFLVSRQARVRGDQRGRPFEAAGVPHQQRGLRHRPPRRHEAVLPEPVVSVLPRSCPRSRWPTGRPTSKGEPAPFTAVWARFTI